MEKELNILQDNEKNIEQNQEQEVVIKVWISLAELTFIKMYPEKVNYKKMS